MEQQEALEILKKGANVFLTGEAGTGKSYTISKFVEHLKEERLNFAITATTGIAASQIGGITIHSFSGIGIKKNLTEDQVRQIKNKKWVRKKIDNTDVVIIDEISMLDADTLDSIDKVFRACKDKSLPFGGIQIVLVGDFYQLPPVDKTGLAKFAFESESWSAANLVICYLTRQYRQDKGEFLDILTAIRNERVEDHHLEVLDKCKNTEATEIKLYTHNLDVDKLNNSKLADIDEKEEVFEMRSGGKDFLIEILKKQCLSPEALKLKKGAVVMFTRNNFEKGYVNGTTGKVVDFKEGFPVVEVKGGERIIPDMAEWSIHGTTGEKEAWIKQIPLRLAWAITIHKSQGMTLDRAFIDLEKVFEYGQAYVAISRMVSLDGLYLRGVSRSVFRMHPDVVEADKKFREASGKDVEAKIPTKQRSFKVSKPVGEGLPF